jgi:hypothetical protein
MVSQTGVLGVSSKQSKSLMQLVARAARAHESERANPTATTRPARFDLRICFSPTGYFAGA